MGELDVSIIIVNYNTLQMTKECIESLLNLTEGILFEIIVVDNASTDGSNEFFSVDERINYIYSQNNLGFGRANNLGGNIAMGKYIFFLNSDTLILENVVAKLFEFVEKNKVLNIGALGTCLVDVDKNKAMSFGEFLTSKRIYNRLLESFGIKVKNYEIEKLRIIQQEGFVEVDFVSGADLFVSKNLFDKLGGFDDDYFMYYEETDLQKRMKDKGFKAYIVNLRDIIHLEGGSFEHKLPFRRKMMMTKGLKIYIRKHFSGISRLHILLLSTLVLVKDLIPSNYKMNEKISLLRELYRNN